MKMPRAGSMRGIKRLATEEESSCGVEGNKRPKFDISDYSSEDSEDLWNPLPSFEESQRINNASKLEEKAAKNARKQARIKKFVSGKVARLNDQLYGGIDDIKYQKLEFRCDALETVLRLESEGDDEVAGNCFESDSSGGGGGGGEAQSSDVTSGESLAPSETDRDDDGLGVFDFNLKFKRRTDDQVYFEREVPIDYDIDEARQFASDKYHNELRHARLQDQYDVMDEKVKMHYARKDAKLMRPYMRSGLVLFKMAANVFERSMITHEEEDRRREAEEESSEKEVENGELETEKEEGDIKNNHEVVRDDSTDSDVDMQDERREGEGEDVDRDVRTDDAKLVKGKEQSEDKDGEVGMQWEEGNKKEKEGEYEDLKEVEIEKNKSWDEFEGPEKEKNHDCQGGGLEGGYEGDVENDDHFSPLGDSERGYKEPKNVANETGFGTSNSTKFPRTRLIVKDGNVQLQSDYQGPKLKMSYNRLRNMASHLVDVKLRENKAPPPPELAELPCMNARDRLTFMYYQNYRLSEWRGKEAFNELASRRVAGVFEYHTAEEFDRYSHHSVTEYYRRPPLSPSTSSQEDSQDSDNDFDIGDINNDDQVTSQPSTPPQLSQNMDTSQEQDGNDPEPLSDVNGEGGVEEDADSPHTRGQIQPNSDDDDDMYTDYDSSSWSDGEELPWHEDFIGTNYLKKSLKQLNAEGDCMSYYSSDEDQSVDDCTVPTKLPTFLNSAIFDKFRETEAAEEAKLRRKSDDIWRDVSTRREADASAVPAKQMGCNKGKLISKSYGMLEEEQWRQDTFNWTIPQSILTGSMKLHHQPLWFNLPTPSPTTAKSTKNKKPRPSSRSTSRSTDSSSDDEESSDDDEKSAAQQDDSSSSDSDVDLDFGVDYITHSRYNVLEEKFQGHTRYSLPSPRCLDLWTCVKVDDGLNDILLLGLEEGWISLTEIYNGYIGNLVYPPSAALNKIMLDGLRDLENDCCKFMVYESLLLTFSYFRPGPDDPTASNIYLDSMNKLTYPNRKVKQAQEHTYWEFLVDLIQFDEGEDPVWENDRLPEKRFVDEDNEYIEKKEIPVSIFSMSGHSMLLSFWLRVLEVDLNLWTEWYTLNNNITIEQDVQHRPLIAKVLFNEGEIRWNARCRELCEYYVSSVVKGTDTIQHGSIRQLVRMTAKLFELKELSITGLKNRTNTNIVQMARNAANFFFDEKEKIEMELLETELYLLEPCWLSSLVSTFFLSQLTGTSVSGLPTFTDIVSKFVNVACVDDEMHDSTPGPSGAGGQSREEEEPAAFDMSQSQCHRKPKGNLAITISPQQSGKKTKRINLNKRNHYGEYPLHIACKKGKLDDIRQILRTSGVNVNVTDHNKNTPLHEAVMCGSLESVQLLLNFVPYPSVSSFFKPAAASSPTNKSPVASTSGTNKNNPNKDNNHINVVALDNNGDSPLHYAIMQNHPTILEEMLKFVAKHDEKGSRIYPSLREVLGQKMSNETSQALNESAELKEILARYRIMSDEIEAARSGGSGKPTSNTLSLSTMKSPWFPVMVKNALERYISSQRLYIVYRLSKNMMHDINLEKPNINDMQEISRYSLVNLDLLGGKEVSRFSQPSQFNLVLGTETKIENVKRLEDMIYWWLKMPDLDKRNPGLLVVDRMYPDHLDSCPAVDHSEEETEPEPEQEGHQDSESYDEELHVY